MTDASLAAIHSEIAKMAAEYDKNRSASANVVPLSDIVKRPVVSAGEWLVASLAAQDNSMSPPEYALGSTFIPTIEQLRDIPRMFDGVSLLTSQLAIVASIAHAPTRVVTVHDGAIPRRNAIAVAVGNRPVVRLNFAPAGTGKTLMSIASALTFVKKYLPVYQADDTWRADLFGCVGDLPKPIAPLVVLIVSTAVQSQWVETAAVCAAAFSDGDAYTTVALPKPGVATAKKACILNAIDASIKPGCGAVVYVVSSADAQRALADLPYLPAAIVMDEVAHDASSAKYVPVPFTLLVTASPRAIMRSLSGKRHDSILRTVFSSSDRDAEVRVAALNTAGPYYKALVREAAAHMPPFIYFCEIKIRNRSTIMLNKTTDPCQHITRDELCKLMNVDPSNKLTLQDLLSAEGRDPNNRMANFNMDLFKRRFTQTGENECIACRMEVHLGASSCDETDQGEDDYVLRAGNVVVTPCCSTMICETCLLRLHKPKKCPQCSVQLDLAGLPLIFSCAPPAPAATLSPAPRPPQDVHELLERFRAMPTQDRPCSTVVNEMLDYAGTAGVKRAFVSWSRRDAVHIQSMQLAADAREVSALHGRYSHEKPLKKRKLNDDMIAQFKAPKGPGDKLSVLVANSIDAGNEQQVAGLNLAGTQLVIAIGHYDRWQIISRAMRMGSFSQQAVIVANFNRVAHE